MIAKINLDGKDCIAVVFNEFINFDYLAEFRDSLTTILGTVNNELVNEDEINIAHLFLKELYPDVSQTYDMMGLYFGEKYPVKKALKKVCEIYI